MGALVWRNVRSSILSGIPCLLLPAATACGAAAVASSRIEDRARRDVPIAICRKALTSTDTTEGGAPRLEAYWSVLFPEFRGFSSPLQSTARDCVGDAPLTLGSGPGTALTLGPADSTITGGEGGIQAVWLRGSSSGSKSTGALALVRPRPSELDVYAIGAYSGSTQHSKLELALMDSAPVLLARDDSCADAAAGTECESTLSVYLAAGGQLRVAVRVPTERFQVGALKDLGRVQWRLTTEAPVFDANTMRLKEKLSLHDARDNEVRKLEGQRAFVLRGRELVTASETLWSRVGQF
ncbi:MAG: hypothetical protein M3O36_15975 [Myxococcota bacterium]|nr:hypothetical protein [Myxococcota bacterium]